MVNSSICNINNGEYLIFGLVCRGYVYTLTININTFSHVFSAYASFVIYQLKCEIRIRSNHSS